MADETHSPPRDAHVVSVFGAFNSRALVEMPAEVAAEWFGVALGDCGPHNVIDAARADIARMPAAVAASTLAAMTVALAYELEHPYNSATSKSMCAGQLREALKELRALAPPERKADAIDDLAAAREKRLAAAAGSAAASDLPRT